jgi:hypothetical protein
MDEYICMGYYEPAKLAAMTEDERNAMIQQMAISFKVYCKPIISQARAPAVHDHSRGNKVLHREGGGATSPTKSGNILLSFAIASP